jgi:peptide/nickel transport system substrate-binding protein
VKTLAALALLLHAGAAPLHAEPRGTLTLGVHVSLAPRWLDPAESEGTMIPFMLLYAIHDALVKPTPAAPSAPSLAESWTMSKDGLAFDFVLRKGATFHHGDPVTAEDVRFSFGRSRGAAAALMKERVREVQVVGPEHVRFVLREPWPDFMTFYGTTASGAGWVVPRSTSSGSARKVSGRRRSARDPTGSSPSSPASSSWSRPTRAIGGRRRA